MSTGNKISPLSFAQSVHASIDNDKISDKDFRQFIRDTVKIVKGASDYPLNKQRNKSNV